MPQLDLDGANSKISADTMSGQSGTTVTVQSGHNLVGSGSGLTALPAGNLTGSLPAISGASLTSLPATGVVDMFMTNHFSRDLTAASGTQDITGFGFNPTNIYIYIAIEGAVGCCFGQHGDGHQRSFSTTEANNQHLSAGTIIRLYTSYSGTNQHGTGSFITDGYRITWTKYGTPTGTAYGWCTGWRV